MIGTNPKILDGLRVIELASILAGPSVGTFLAEQGAHVTKIENPKTGGDPTRNWKTTAEDPTSTISAYYCSVNWGKDSLKIDLKDASGHAQLLSLLGSADVLIHNFKGGDDAKLQLDYASLKSQFPKLIVAHISGYEVSDTRPAFDLAIQAESGLLSINGTKESGPVKMPIAFVDILAAHQLKEAILLSLIQRGISEKGCYIHVSLFDAAVSCLTNIANNVLMGGMDPGLSSNLHANIAPYGEMLVSSDGHSIVLAVGTDHQFAELCSILGADEQFQNKFSTNLARLSERKYLGDELLRLSSKKTLSELETALVEHKVPFGRIKSVKHVLGQLPENYFLNQDIEGHPTKRIRSAVFSISS